MPICEIYSVYKKHRSDFEDCESMAAAETDPDMKALLKGELDELRDALDKDGNDLKISLCQKIPTRTITSLWKYARARAATRLLFSVRNL